MTTVTERSGVWKNSDGMRVAFGLEQAEKSRVGSRNQAGSFKTIEADILASEMAAFSVQQFVNNVPNACIPAGSLLVEARLEVYVAFDSAGSALTLDLGMAKQDGTDIDIDGIDAAINETDIDDVGNTITCDGALINTVLTYDSYPTVRANTATATAGKAKLILTYLPVGDLAD